MGTRASASGADRYTIVVLWKPKTTENVGTVIRSARLFGASVVAIVSSRCRIPTMNAAVGHEKGIPVVFLADEKAFRDFVPREARIVPVELAQGSTSLDAYSHPPRSVYVFGPEDGSLPADLGQPVQIPSDGCLNLATAATVVLYDRRAKELRHAAKKARDKFMAERLREVLA